MQRAQWIKLLRLIGQRDGWTCHYCSKPLYQPDTDHNLWYEILVGGRWVRIGPEPATVDHLIPQVRGGTDHTNNLRLACPLCNAGKRDRPYQAFADKLLLWQAANLLELDSLGYWDYHPPPPPAWLQREWQLAGELDGWPPHLL